MTMDADWFDNEGRDSEPCRLATCHVLSRPWLLVLLSLALAAVLVAA